MQLRFFLNEMPVLILYLILNLFFTEDLQNVLFINLIEICLKIKTNFRISYFFPPIKVNNYPIGNTC